MARQSARRGGRGPTVAPTAMRAVAVAVTAALLLHAVTAQAPLDDALERLRRAVATREVDVAVDRGLDFLLESRNDDGSFGDSNRNALTSLVLLALLARGHVPGDGRHGRAIIEGLDYLLADGRQNEEGYFGDDGSRMYGHGITVLLLAEVLGMGASPERERRMLAACERGIELILRAQAVEKPPQHAGGWRYRPESIDSDLSMTVWMVMALRAAQNAGMGVPRAAIDRAVAYVRKCHDRRAGAFRYQATPTRDPELPITAAGVLSLQVCGVYSGREVEAAADWLLRETPRWRREGWEGSWFYYGVYYLAQAAHQLGGEHADVAREAIEELLLPGGGRPSAQRPDGSWDPPPRSGEERRAGPVYRTAMAVLALGVEYRLLPISQR